MVSLGTHIHSSSIPCSLGELCLRFFASSMLGCQGLCCLFSLLYCILLQELAEGLIGDADCCVQVTQACQFVSCLLHCMILPFTSSINSNVGILNFIVFEACTVQWVPATLACFLLVCCRATKGFGPRVAEQPHYILFGKLEHVSCFDLFLKQFHLTLSNCHVEIPMLLWGVSNLPLVCSIGSANTCFPFVVVMVDVFQERNSKAAAMTLEEEKGIRQY
jgi:hypothetical protein